MKMEMTLMVMDALVHVKSKKAGIAKEILLSAVSAQITVSPARTLPIVPNALKIGWFMTEFALMLFVEMAESEQEKNVTIIIPVSKMVVQRLVNQRRDGSAKEFHLSANVVLRTA